MSRGFPIVIAALSVLHCSTPLPAQSVRLPNGQVLREIDFERHVHAVLDRQGCNAGGCHGSSRGKGRFVLSLIAESPERDHEALTRFSRGRLLNFSAPEQSLLLQRPLGRNGHAGGKRLDLGSWEYEVLRQWIAAGAPRRPGSGKITRVEVEPARIVFASPREACTLKVFVRFADGSRHDMTAFCDFRHPGEKVIRVTGQGEVTSLERGLDTVLVVYRGHVAPVPIAVAHPPRAAYPKVPEVNYIDRELFGRLRELNVVPADLTTDAEFLRRVHVDVLGSLPTPDELRHFVSSKAPDRRARKIDELLAHPRHSAIWANRWLAWTGNTTDGQAPFHYRLRGWRQLWFDWLRQRFQKNVPFDQLAEAIVCADSREGKPPQAWLRDVEELVKRGRHGLASDYAKRRTLDLFWRSFENRSDPGERIASAFLGIRLDCARCHQHPLAPWTPADHQAFTDTFRQVRYGNSPETAALAQAELTRRHKELTAALDVKGLTPEAAQAIRDRHQLDLWQAALKEVYLGARIEKPTRGPAPITGGLDLSQSVDPRRVFVRWLTARENPYFARNIVNRTWAYYFGRGLVEPFDGFSDANPPSHPVLLDLLAQDFIAGGFDLRRLERTILNSRAYQLAFVPPSASRLDPALFASREATRVAARVELDMICDATGSALQLENAPPGARAIELVDLHTLNAYVHDNDHWKEREEAMVRLFGRKEPMDRCRGADHTNYLHLMGYPNFSRLITSGQRFQAVTAWDKGDDSMIDEAFLATLSRPPTPEERTLFKRHIVQHPRGEKRNRAIEDVFWALLRSPEFIMRR
jgi:hypothetical protein